jgi:soluble lytic murein transglycosylase
MKRSGYLRWFRQRRPCASLFLGSLLALVLIPIHLKDGTHKAQAMNISETTFIYSVLKAQGMGLSETSLRKLAAGIVEESRKHSFDPMLVLAVIKVESRFDHEAVSHRGAQGLMQIRPPAVAAVVDQGDIPDLPDETSLKDPIVNVKIGTAYLRQLKQMFNDLRLALTAYNSGPTRVKKTLAAKQEIRFRYANKVFSAQRLFEKDRKEATTVLQRREFRSQDIG